jgi:putative spermidine/putrescine transport system ATP-binding protein
MSDAVVELQQVTKSFGAVRAVDGVSLAISRGEFFALLGPSGCGKTTTLRLIAGLETPDAGELRLLGEVANDRRPWQRPVAMVFQHYALFPHLDVERNVAFGLVERHTPADETARRVARALELVRLDPAEYARRRPAELSGGQRQRVALARALVLEPAILLLDEPLGALDLQLRKEMQLELKSLNRSLGITFVFVTHDQEEALAMSDRIAVMDHARVAQIGAPADIYERPRTAFVARFIGECNLMERRRDGGTEPIAVRPEWMELGPEGAAPAGAEWRAGAVRDVVYLGETVHVVLALDGGGDARVALRNESRRAALPAWRIGERAVAWWHPDAAVVVERG